MTVPPEEMAEARTTGNQRAAVANGVAGELHQWKQRNWCAVPEPIRHRWKWQEPVPEHLEPEQPGKARSIWAFPPPMCHLVPPRLVVAGATPKAMEERVALEVVG